MARTAVGYFRDRAAADAAYDALLECGFAPNDISVVGHGAGVGAGLADAPARGARDGGPGRRCRGAHRPVDRRRRAPGSRPGPDHRGWARARRAGRPGHWRHRRSTTPTEDVRPPAEPAAPRRSHGPPII